MPEPIKKPVNARKRVERLRNLRQGYDLTAAVGFWKELYGEDLIEVYAQLVQQASTSLNPMGGDGINRCRVCYGALPEHHPWCALEATS